MSISFNGWAGHGLWVLGPIVVAFGLPLSGTWLPRLRVRTSPRMAVMGCQCTAGSSRFPVFVG